MTDPAKSFGPFVLDPAAGQVCRDGEPVALGQKAFDLLRVLADANGEAVSKSDLLERVWPGNIVEEGNLSVQVAGLRKALGKRPDGQEWIVNVPRLGYRLLRGEGRPPLAAAIARPALAVLPFENLTGDSGDAYFADGMVSDIITALSRFSSFAVVSRNAAFAYRGANLDLRAIAGGLGALYVLEGSVRRAGDKLRINVGLVDGPSGANLWTHRFDGELADVFDFQDQITAQVATMVAPAVTAHELERSRFERPGSIATYDILLRAHAELRNESEAGNVRAFALLQQGLEREPDNARLLSQAAWALEHRITMGWPSLTDNDLGRCLDYARRGIQHALNDPMALAQCGMALLQTGKEYAAGYAAIRAAIQANPYDLHVSSVYAISTLHVGALDEAEAECLRAIALAPSDPDTRFPLTGLAMLELIRGNFEAAIAWGGRSLAFNDKYDPTYWMLIAANAHLGRMGAAHDFLERLRQRAPGISLERIRAGQPAKYPERFGAVLEGLRLAGLD